MKLTLYMICCTDPCYSEEELFPDYEQRIFFDKRAALKQARSLMDGFDLEDPPKYHVQTVNIDNLPDDPKDNKRVVNMVAIRPERHGDIAVHAPALAQTCALAAEVLRQMINLVPLDFKPEVLGAIDSCQTILNEVYENGVIP